MDSLNRLLEQAAQARREKRLEVARADLDKAIIIGRSLGDKIALAQALIQRGQTEYDIGRAGSAIPLYEEAIRSLRQTSDALQLAEALRQLGRLHQDRGDFDEAEPCLGEALAIYEALEDAPPLTLPGGGVKHALTACRHQLAALRVPLR